jgi:hypothetical protein
VLTVVKQNIRLLPSQKEDIGITIMAEATKKDNQKEMMITVVYRNVTR